MFFAGKEPTCAGECGGKYCQDREEDCNCALYEEDKWLALIVLVLISARPVAIRPTKAPLRGAAR